ncbi:hypothetical protein V7T02_14325, partial [Segatella copri]|uniref:hypothetical protein n=1 Tax=Segatella copri TaxID=165179 RepID=UPI002FF02EFC
FKIKKYMPLEGLRWSRDSGSALCDTPQNSRSRTGWGGNICFFRYEFLFFGVSFVSNATPCLYFLTFPDSIQAQNLCKSLAGVRWFKVCGAKYAKVLYKRKIPHPA